MRGRLWVDTMLVGWIESVSDSLTSIIGHYTFATTVHVYWFILIILQKTRIALSLNKHRNFTCSRSVSSIYIQFVKDMWRTCVFFREKRGKNRIHSRSSQQTVHFTNVFPFTVVFCVASLQTSPPSSLQIIPLCYLYDSSICRLDFACVHADTTCSIWCDNQGSNGNPLATRTPNPRAHLPRDSD